MKDEIAGSFKAIHYEKIIIGLILGSCASLWIKFLSWGSFLKLLLSAVLFFGVYGTFLLITKEELAVEIFDQVFGKILKKVGKTNV